MSKWSVLLISALLLLPAIKVSAQEQKEYSRFEVSASAGLLVGGNPYLLESPSSFPIMYDLTCKYFPQSWLSIGLSVGNDMMVYWGDDFKVLLTPSVQFHWLRKRSFTAYSGFGYSISTHWDDLKTNLSKKYWYQGFQYTPIGITFGRSLFGLAELGYGPRYFPLRLGIGYRF